MRKALNENPVAQIGLLAVLGLGVAILLMTRLGSGGEESATPAAGSAGAAAEEAGAAPADSAPATGSEPTVEGPGVSIEPAPVGGTSTAGSFAFVPGKGLPKSVVVAYAQDKAVVLLVMRRGAIDDRAVKQAVQRLRSRPDVSVFVTGAAKIARFSRITEGVNVNQVPALVVIQPRKLTGNVPVAGVSYGFRGAPSIVQTVQDALYTGRQLPSYPR
jgi:hypothetical protein